MAGESTMQQGRKGCGWGGRPSPSRSSNRFETTYRWPNCRTTGFDISTPACRLPVQIGALLLVVEPDTESLTETIQWCEREAIRLAPLVECQGATESMIYTFLVQTFLHNLKREPDRFYSVHLSTTPGAHHLLKATFHIKIL